MDPPFGSSTGRTDPSTLRRVAISDKTCARLTPVDPLDAYTDFEGRLLRRLSTRVVPFAWGNAYLDDDLPSRFYSNLLRVETDLTGVSADDLIGAADEILGDGRFEHLLLPEYFGKLSFQEFESAAHGREGLLGSELAERLGR